MRAPDAVHGGGHDAPGVARALAAGIEAGNVGKAVGVEPARICKTLSFKLKDGTGILIQVAGDARVDNKKYKDYFGEKARMLSPEEVPQYTNHEIGGVCAFGVTRDDVKVYCDESMLRFDTVFPACGSSNSCAEFTPDELFEVSRQSIG